MEKKLSYTILVVEDDAALREMLRWALDREGLHVLAAADGVEALTMLAAQSPSIILTDLQMPQKNGLDLAIEVRQRPDYQDIPIVLLSATPPTPCAQTAVFDAILAKPIALASLMGCIHSLLAQGSSRPT